VVGLSVNEIATRFGITGNAVRKMIREGRVSVLPDGTLDPRTFLREYAENTKLEHSGGGKLGVTKEGNSSAAGQSLAQVRLAREALETQLVQLEYRKKVGDLLPADEVEEAASDLGRRVRDLLLAIPPRLAPVVAGLTDPEECFKVLEKEVNAVCDELSATKGHKRRH
jgi:hypothetical protein